MSKKTKAMRLEEELKTALVNNQSLLNTLQEREHAVNKLLTELIAVNKELESKKQTFGFQIHLLDAKRRQYNELEKEFIKQQYMLNGVIKSFESLQEHWARVEPNITHIPLGATGWIRAEKKVETE